MKKNILFIVFILTFFIGFTFDWPVTDGFLMPIHSYFAQKQGDNFVHSIIFSHKTDVFASDKGRILLKDSENYSDNGWFDSPLGNSIVLGHKNDLLTIYGNLDEVLIDDNTKDVDITQKIATSGYTGWYENVASFAFQIADIKNKTLINPLVLMKERQQPQGVTIKNVVAVNKKGSVFDLATQKYLSTGTYYLYREATSMPFKTQVSVNGAAVEIISYDLLRQIEDKLCVEGKKNYSCQQIYSKDNLQFLAEVVLSRGKNTILVTTYDILGNQNLSRYFVEVK